MTYPFDRERLTLLEFKKKKKKKKKTKRDLSHESKPSHPKKKKWDFSTNMKALYVFGQISHHLIPFYSIYLSCSSRKFEYIDLFHHLCYEISGHLSLGQVVQIDKVCIFFCQVTVVYSFLITWCPRLASQGVNNTFLILQNTNWTAMKSICVKVFVRLHRSKRPDELPKYQKVCS